eukprot:TRINITY_DN71861_c0_g1_i1.p1 TRINITY_DN71861_c0_g1~~TRINITY_DN71861_c0_g1_i1.p1  ORF type:complete len:903 (+),score=177.68 TRINITY_DN71861_c0_g1_i1:275-2983(+)
MPLERQGTLGSLCNKKTLEGCLSCNPSIFGQVTSQGFALLASFFVIKQHSARKTLIERGKPGSDFIVVIHGHISMRIDEHCVEKLSKGDFFGALNFLGAEDVWSATLVTDVPTTVAILSHDQLAAIKSEWPAVADTFQHIFATREACRQRKVRLSEECPLFNSFAAETLANLSEKMVLKLYAPDREVFGEGDISDHMYLLDAGRVAIYQGKRRVADISSGTHDSSFGDSSMFGLTETRRTRAITQTMCMVRILHVSIFLHELELTRDQWIAEEIQQLVPPATEDIVECLGQFELIREMDVCSPEFLQYIAENLEECIFLPDQKISPAYDGEGHEKAFILLSGATKVQNTNGTYSNLNKRCIGRLLFPTENSRITTAGQTVKAESFCYGLELRRGCFIRALEVFQEEREAFLAMSKLKNSRGSRMTTKPNKTPFERAQLIAKIQRAPFLEDLSKRFVVRLSERCEDRIFAPGELIMEEGEPGHTMYIVVGGSGYVYVNDSDASNTHASNPGTFYTKVDLERAQKVAMVGEGTIFGELAVLGIAQVRQATVVAENFLHAWEIQQEDMLRLLREFPDAYEKLQTQVCQHLESSVQPTLAEVPLFKKFDPHFITLLGVRCLRRMYLQNSKICRSGQPCKGMIVVSKGLAALWSKKRKLFIYPESSVYGATIMLGYHTVSPCTLIAEQTCHILIVTPECYTHAVNAHPCKEAMEELAETAREAHEQLENEVRWVTTQAFILQAMSKKSGTEQHQQDMNQLRQVLQEWRRISAHLLKSRKFHQQRQMFDSVWVVRSNRNKANRQAAERLALTHLQDRCEPISQQPSPLATAALSRLATPRQGGERGGPKLPGFLLDWQQSSQARSGSAPHSARAATGNGGRFEAPSQVGKRPPAVVHARKVWMRAYAT